MRTENTGRPAGAELEDRVAQFAARAISVCEALPERTGAAHLRDQLFRSATSVAANYAEASVPESRKDFAHKIGVALKELVESRMWLRIIALKQYVEPRTLAKLLAEADELVRIFNASVKTARQRLADEKA
ncbi:MAG: four helix bundle protein [Kiritimatiellae bacterium]|nr:four helix bundle protein [Kiritimatiellia bacterium]